MSKAYRVPRTKEFHAELREHIAELNRRLEAVDMGCNSGDRCAAFMIGVAEATTAHLLDLLDGRVESRTEARATLRRWRAGV